MSENFVTRFPEYKPSGRTVNGRRIAVGIDIDGCVDPGMYKHETGFAIASIFHFKLQMITPIAMRAWMYVNAYSMDRGITRFVALYKWFDILRQTPTVQAIGLELPTLPYLRRWAEVTRSLSPEALRKFIEEGDFSSIEETADKAEQVRAELLDIVKWSDDVNKRADVASANLLAFPAAASVIRKLDSIGVDVCAVSGTPEDHVISHLREYGLIDCFRGVFAQQAGKKHLALTTLMAGKSSGFGTGPLLDGIQSHYDACSMFGDAPKDYEETLLANKILTGSEQDPVRMYFIEVGRENDSWQHFQDKVLDAFVSGSWSREDEGLRIGQAMANLDRDWDPNVMPIDTFPQKS